MPHATTATATPPYAAMGDTAQPIMTDNDVVALIRDLTSREDVRRDARDPSSKEVTPGITIDLGHRAIERLPDEAIDIIKDEIERLAISHNQVSSFPSRLAECTRLRYLNVRYNAFREFPTPVLQLTALEILDISNNRLQRLPDEISNLSSLKVLAISRNRIERLPTSLGDMNSLRMLKFDKNRLVFPPPDVCTLKDDTPAPSDENEREALLTSQMKKWLRQQSIRQKLQVDSEGEADERDVETPRPPKRIGSGRFPVRPSIGGMDALTPDSPSAPPIPLRSHYRGQSAQTPREPRPTISPLVSGNDRNRSQSESVMSANTTTRTKRLGIVPPRGSRGRIDEIERRPSQSHARGLSHGSLLSTNNITGVQAFQVPATASLAESGELERQRNMATSSRLSGVMEHKRRSRAPDSAVEAAKNIRYAISQIHQPLATLVSTWKRGGAMQKGELQRRMNQSSTLANELGRFLQEFDTLAEEDEEEAKNLSYKIRSVCANCVKDYGYISQAISNHAVDLVRYGDPRVVRSLFLLLYGSTYELRNACTIIGISFSTGNRERTRNSFANQQTLTPTQGRPLPGRRMRAGTGFSQGNVPMNSIQHYPLPQIPLGSNPNSRSNTLTSIVSATPRSGESFSTLAMSRSNTMQGVDISDEDARFENLFLKLQSIWREVEARLPDCHERFEQSRRIADLEYRPDTSVRYAELSKTCGVVIEAARALTRSLSTIQLKDSRVRQQLSFWQQCWHLTSSWAEFVQCAKDPLRYPLVPVEVKQAMKPIQKQIKDVTQSIITSPWASMMTEVSKLSNGAAPLNYHTSNQSTNSTFSSTSTLTANTSFPPGSQGYPSALNNSHVAASLGYSNGATGSGSPFGLSTPVPATPMSAALGPAALATVPSTPGQQPMRGVGDASGLHMANGSIVLEGGPSQLNWLVRADALLQQQGSTARRVG